MSSPPAVEPASPTRAARYRAAWVLPITGPPIRDGAVAVDSEGRIAAVGPAAAVSAPAGAMDLDLGDVALIPGLVNVHAHPELVLFRGHIEDVDFPRWIGRLMRRKLALPDLDYRAAARWACVESLAAGITTLAATEDSGAALDALLETGMRGTVYREVFGPAPAQAENALRELRARVDAMRLRETDLVRVGVSPHAPYTVSDALYRATADYARDEALPMAVHLAESSAESELVRHGRGAFAEALAGRGIDTRRRAPSPVALLDRLGVLAQRPLLIHCIRLRQADIGRVADSGCAVAHCPTANARLGHGLAPLPRLLDAAVPVGLGTDSVASNNRQDLLEEARTAQLLHRARHREPRLLPAAAVLEMATLSGARALGLDRRIGSLEPGKDADLCAVSLAGAHVRPVHDPAAAVVLAARGSDVVLSAVRGRVLYRDGRWPGLDVDALRGALEAEADRLRAEADRPR